MRNESRVGSLNECEAKLRVRNKNIRLQETKEKKNEKNTNAEWRRI